MTCRMCPWWLRVRSLVGWRGAYLRNGPGLFEAGERRLEHWFDGYAMLLRVSFGGAGKSPCLTTRFVASDAEAAVRRGSMGFPEFMTPLLAPGSGWMGAVRSFVALAAGEPTDNACVNVVRHGGELLAMTETQRSWFRIDPVTLQTRGRVQWSGAPVGQLGTAHPQHDPAGGGMINVGTAISPPFSSSYQVYRMPAEAPWERELLASIPCDDRAAPRWMHSFGVTRRAVVLIEQPAAYAVGAMVGVATASHGSIQWKGERGTRVHVLDRKSGAVRTHVMEPFFFFHVCNSFDLDGDNGGVSVDVCVFDDPEILTSLSLARLTDESLARDLPPSRICRLTLPTSGAPSLTPLDDEDVSGGFADLPTIHPDSAGNSAYRFVWGIGASRPTTVSNRLVKSDVTGGGGDAAFEVEGMLPGEPLFVPRPDGAAEDDGVLLSMGSDPDGGSSLYVLCAAEMRLLARCRSPEPLPAGFHGEWVPSGARAMPADDLQC